MKKIPTETIKRLFPYLRALVCLDKEGTAVVPSSRLADICHINPAVIRKDLSYFGEFGTRGVGYDVKKLKVAIREILNLKPAKTVALVGVGNIGRALLSYQGFALEGFTIGIAFDNDKNKIGTAVRGIPVLDISQMEKYVAAENIQLAILAVPEQVAPKIARRLEKAGIRAILSFAPCQLAMPSSIKVTCVDLSTEMARLIYYSSEDEP